MYVCTAPRQRSPRGRDGPRRLRCAVLLAFAHSRIQLGHLGTHSHPHKQVLAQEQGVGVRVEAVVVMLGQCIRRCVLRIPTARVVEAAAAAARTAFGVGANVDENESAGVVHAADADWGKTSGCRSTAKFDTVYDPCPALVVDHCRYLPHPEAHSAVANFRAALRTPRDIESVYAGPLGALGIRLLQAGERNTQRGPGVGRTPSCRLGPEADKQSPDGVDSRRWLK